MDLKILLLVIQVLVLALQVGCFVYGIKKDKEAADMMGGFGIWGFIPNVTLMVAALSL